MKLPLKDFQDAVGELRTLNTTQQLVGTENGAVLLNAPTGSGKTLMAAALIEELLAGTDLEGDGGDEGLTFLWLSDQPELNRRTHPEQMLTPATIRFSPARKAATMNSPAAAGSTPSSTRSLIETAR